MADKRTFEADTLAEASPPRLNSQRECPQGHTG